MDSTLDQKDDSWEAIIFIVVVFIFYSLAHVCLLLMRMMGDEFVQDSSKDFRLQSSNQENQLSTLKELADEQRRLQLWKIYYGEKIPFNEQMQRAEIFRIRNIERQLSINSHDDDITDSHRSIINDYSLFMANQRHRRRSSLDYQIANEWKEVSDQLKKHDVWPWMIRRLLIRRHLRRQRFQSESIEPNFERQCP